MSILDTIFPNHTCLVCRREINESARGLVCGGCVDKLPFHEKVCDVCGCSAQELAHVCDRCKPKKETDKWHFNRARSVFEYKSPVVEMVLALKYNAIGDVAKFVVPLMVAAVARYGMGVDVVLPVPLSPKRAKQRGYNQAELIANGVAGALGVPMVDNFLVRAKNTTPHKKMTYKQRCENLHGAFEIVPPYSTIKGKRVLLIDDVFTTGATVDECARVLKKAKPKSIEVLTVAGVSQMARKSK